MRDNYAGAPAELLRSMREAVTDAKGGTVTAQLTSSCRSVMRKVVGGGCSDRSGALDLLTLDALMTGAMESAASTASSCEAAASSLLSVISEAASIE